MRSTFPSNFIRERHLRDEKYITIYEQFRPNFNSRTLTPKFYSKYADVRSSYASMLGKVREHFKTAKEKRLWPETTNQWYGWFVTPLIEEDRSDDRLHFPLKSTEMMKHEMRLKQQEANHSSRTQKFAISIKT